jgi:Kdo2-lipid IVA lauroyltransferase/acyltransferase
MLQPVGALLGSTLTLTSSRMLQVTRENIDLCYPQLSRKRRTQLVHRSLRETGKTITETAFAWASPRETCMRSITSVEGKADLDGKRSQDRGIIFILPHLGNWEIINHFLGHHYALTHMYLPNQAPKLDKLIQSYRSRTGTNFVKADLCGIRKQIQILEAGGAIGTMPDQEPEVHTGKFAHFFGQPALTGELIPRLAKRTGAICVVAYCKRLRGGAGFRVILKQVKPASPGEAMTVQTLNDAIEGAVREVPEQYLWSYKRFRTREEGEKELYQFSDHPIRVLLEKMILITLLLTSANLNLATLQLLSASLARYFLFVRGKHVRVASRNVSICFAGQHAAEQKRLVRSSIQEFSRTIFETGRVWHCSDDELEAMLLSVEGLEHMTLGSAIVLTPPLGNREVVMRYLGLHYKTTEYYHPNSNTSLDELIRRQRASMGIALLDHTNQRRKKLLENLHDGQVITLCPDQQPRLRSGAFVPFFGIEALTTLTLPYILKESRAVLVFGIALREDTGFRLYLHPCEYDAGADDKTMLADINRQLEEVVAENCDQYRWSDKRFNIRPRGTEKLYRF